VRLEVSPGVSIKIAKAAVGRVVTEDGTPAALEGEPSPADDPDEPGSTGGTAGEHPSGT
jgi:hypothetical protein